MRVGLTWLGHSTVLVELAGLTLLTDPFFRARLGPLRRHGPVPDPHLLPAVDLVLLSHAHPDHFDAGSLAALRGHPRLLVPIGMGAVTRRVAPAAQVEELRVGEHVRVGDWTATAIAARHWRWPPMPRADSIGYLLEGPIGLYFAGDTGTFAGMRALAGRVDLALLPIGRWGPQPTPGHLTPRSAALVAAVIGARAVLPIHWGTLYPRGLDRFMPGPLHGPGAAFRTAMDAVAPDAVILGLVPGGSTSIALSPT